MTSLYKGNRLISLLLALIMLALPIASLAASGEAIEGGYREQPITLPAGYVQHTYPERTPDGGFCLAAQKEDGGWDLLTYKNLAEAPHILPLAYEGPLSGVFIAPDGNILAYVDAMSMPIEEADPAQEEEGVQYVFSSDDMRNELIWFSPEGVELGRYELAGFFQRLQALSGMRVAAQSYMSPNISAYDAQGKELIAYEGENPLTFLAAGEELYLFFSDRVITLDAETGKVNSTIDVELDRDMVPALGRDGTLYLLAQDGIRRLTPGAQGTSEVLAMTGMLIGDPSNLTARLLALDDGSLVAAIDEGTGSGMMSFGFGGVSSPTLMGYAYDAEKQAEDRPQLVITALRDSAFLRKLVSDFQRARPDLEVKLQTVLGEYDEASLDDAIRTLNTQLLAGKGGDVLVLDGLPIDKYIQRGILEDLTDILTGIDFLPQIYASSRYYDGKLYAMPAGFSFPVLWGNPEDIAGISKLEDLMNVPLAEGQTLFNPRTPGQWLELLYPVSEPAFRDEQGLLRFDTPAFESFLEIVKELYLSQGGSEVEAEDQAVQVLSSSLSVEEIRAMLNGAIALYPSQIDGLTNLSMSYSIGGGQPGNFVGMPTLEGIGAAYTPKMLAGINAHSDMKQDAAELLKGFYSAGMQEGYLLGGMPVLKSALDGQIDQSIQMTEDGAMAMAMVAFDEDTMIELRNPSRETWEELRALCGELNTPILADEALLGFIIEESGPFFTGSITAAQAAEAIQQRAYFYLNE